MRTWTALLIAGLVLAAPATAAASAPKKVDLAVTKLAATPTVVGAGHTIGVRDAVRGSGAPASKVGFYLSHDRVRDKRDARLRRVQKLRAFHGSAVRKGRAKLVVPAHALSGAYFLLACADAQRTVRERNERNNCRSAGPLLVQGAAAPSTARVTTGGGGVSQIVGKAGGTLSTTDGRGTRYTLTVPADALPDGTTLTMTPIRSLAGTPADRAFTAGVVLGPNGTQLYHPATLTIQAPKSVKPADQLAFGFHGTGAEFHLVPLSPNRRTLEIPITHFSGYGTASDPDGAVQAATERHPPSDPRDQLAQEVAGLLHQARTGEMDEQEALQQALNLIEAYYDTALAPRMRAGDGLADDEHGRAIIQDLLEWERTVALLGGHGREAESFAYILKVVRNSYDRHQRACVDDHDLKEIGIIADRARTLALLGAPEIPPSELFKCAAFTVHIQSRIELHGATEGVFELHGDARAALAGPLLDHAEGTGTTTWDQFSFNHVEVHNGCTETTSADTASGDVLTVKRLVIPADDAGAPAQLDLDIGEPTEHYLYRVTGGPSCSGDTDFNDTAWANDMHMFHQAELSSPDDPVLHIRDVPRTNAGDVVLARRTYKPADVTIPDPSGAFTVSEITTVEILHTPPPA